ncbi:MAG: acetate/propionate family kinase [Acidobacteriota bacterium]
MAILVLNAGSATLKYGLFETGTTEATARGTIEGTDLRASLGEALAAAAGQRIEAVGHRVVHGGTEFRSSVRIDRTVRAALERLRELAPLHNPPALQGIAAAEEALPGTPQIAVFDTAFYAGLPPRAYVYAVPYAWMTDWGIRRFGFHGINHAWCVERAAELLAARAGAGRLVTCHLGNGASATASRRGLAVATTMGYTPMEGLMMGTRSGSIDPGILLAVQRERGLSAEELDEILNHGSGLLGVSGVSSDFREVEAAARAGDARARLALEIYADRVRSAIGALAATLGGLDALVFTAGIGENAAALRASVCEGLEFLGLRLDPSANGDCRPDADVAAGDSRARILVLRAREELMIARETRRVLSGGVS